jgi:hypothetical protein
LQNTTAAKISPNERKTKFFSSKSNLKKQYHPTIFANPQDQRKIKQTLKQTAKDDHSRPT